MPDRLTWTPRSGQDLGRLYETEGIAIVRGALEVKLVSNVERTLMELMAHRAQSVTVALPRPADLDESLNVLREKLPDVERELMLAIRESPAFRELILSDALLKLVDAVSPSAARHFSMDFCMMRIDTRDSEERRFDWHFDTAYTALPASAATCWIPLTPVEVEMGCMRVLPGSHRQPRKVRFKTDLGQKRFSAPKRIELAQVDIDDIEKRSVELPPLGPGDVVFLHGWLLHRSGHNSTSKARWICNPRFCDLLDEEFVRSGWRASRSGTPWVFQEQHPELVIEDSDSDADARS